MDELKKRLRQPLYDGSGEESDAPEQAADAIEALQAQLAEARDKALEEAARMVDCACECREAVLTANTRVERWTDCGRDPCGALDAAAIRALIDKPGTKP